MKMKKIAALTVLVSMAAMILAGCGGSAKAADFTSKSGITVTATDKWKQLTTEEELKDLYTDAVDSDSVDLALRNGDLFFTIEALDCTADIADTKELVTFLKEEVAASGEDAVFDMLSGQLSEDEMALYKQLINSTDENFDKVYQDISNASWFETLETSAPNYEFVGKEDVTVVGKASTLSEYKYSNDDVLLHHYEAAFLKDGVLYTLNSWSDDKTFDKNKEELKALITSAK